MRQIDLRLNRRRYLFPVAVLRPGDQSDLEYMSANALLDTGATVSGIGPRVIRELSLMSSGKNRLGSATDEAFVPYYLFRLGFFTTEQLQLDQPGPGDLPFLFDEIDGFSWSRQTDFDVIVGMDVLQRCDMHFGRGGTCAVRFG